MSPSRHILLRTCPTTHTRSLTKHAGCFDHEEEAARAYDKMMLWCELHNAAGVKGGITNYDPTEYTADIDYLTHVSQVWAPALSALEFVASNQI
jgi:hypothetical protein